ncbi:MAG: hypothetical protein ACYDEJ_06820 [Desulfitobacteriaceae bacterium]
MKKAIYFVCVLFISAILLMTYNNIKNTINFNKEKIGNEYTVIKDMELASNDSHGLVKNYHNNFQNNLWTTTFDYMNSTAYQCLEIDHRDTLKVKSKLKSGNVWVKITQGDLSKSKIQKVQSVNDETVTIDLTQWEPGEINIWLVVENGESGTIRIEQDFHVKT